ncbi:MAG: hypothetical protein BGO77_00700 [Caedibacter sp. 37-49]|nr:MAG: hypothetical protein BGO77_00700 [Caedibacter sp. 37-49]
MLIQLSKSLKIGMLIIILMNLFSCYACDENIQDIGRKVKKSGQVLGGLTATQIEPGMLFMYRATHNAPRNLSYPIIGGVMGITAPIHVRQ